MPQIQLSPQIQLYLVVNAFQPCWLDSKKRHSPSSQIFPQTAHLWQFTNILFTSINFIHRYVVFETQLKSSTDREGSAALCLLFQIAAFSLQDYRHQPRYFPCDCSGGLRWSIDNSGEGLGGWGEFFFQIRHLRAFFSVETVVWFRRLVYGW